MHLNDMENIKITARLSKKNECSSIIEIIDREIIHPLQPYEIFIENEKKIYQISQDNILLNYV